MASASISPRSLMDQIAAGTAPAVLDVRSTLEYAQGHVPGAIHVPFWQVTSEDRVLPGLRARPVVVYCGHGPRAYMAGAMLRRRGFANVTYLQGHMKTWKAMDLPLEVV